MQFHFFHLMPYAYLDLDFDKTYRASWVVLPNTYFDPVKGHELYNRYLDEMEYAEELGFDGLCVNEHHQNAYGLMPSPVVTASALARRTERATIAILGSGFNLREHPLTLAEEHAMLDCITGGRLISGMVRGIGCEYYSMGVNPAFSHERYHEAHDLVVRAWTEPGPFAFEGKHYHFEYVNMWPRPYQTPHPPIWCPSSGSFETIKWASHPDRRYVYLQTFTSFKSVARAMDSYRSLAADHGYTAKADRLGWLVAIYVADTDEAAINEARPHIESLYNKFLHFPPQMLLPPGYTSLESLKHLRSSRSSITGGTKTIEGMMEDGLIIAGSPDTVRRKLTEYQMEARIGHLLCLLQFGTMPADLTQRNMELFTREVMPALAELDGDALADSVVAAQ